MLKNPKLIAVFAYRYDYSLVDDLLKNIGSFIDDYIAWDDRTNNDIWYHEGKTRNMLIEKARIRGAEWILCIDPDERFERKAGQVIRQKIKQSRKIIYGFPFRELWTPTTYRCDGIWGAKTKYILFPVNPGQIFMNLPVHSQWAPVNEEYSRVLLDINLYHLKMIDKKNREARKDIYNKLDPEKKIQIIGYDYLTDESGLRLQQIVRSRKYYPEYNSSYNITQLGD